MSEHLSRRQFMKISRGTIAAVQIAHYCHALTLLMVTA